MKQVKQAGMEVALAEGVDSGPSKLRTALPEQQLVLVGFETHYFYDGQMPVLEQDYEDGGLKQTRVNFLGARGIEAVITVDHTQNNNQASLQWLFYDGHGNVVCTMSNDGLFRLSAFQFRGVWGERESDLGLGKGYCANLGHPEDETGLVYMRARYYEPWTGRFISEDPAQDGVNWYLYADGNPVGKVDKDGEISTSTVLTWIAIIVAASAGLLTAAFLQKFAGYLVRVSLSAAADYLEKKARNLITQGVYHEEAAYYLSIWAGLSEGPLKETLALEAAREGRLGARKIAVGVMLRSVAHFLRGIADE